MPSQRLPLHPRPAAPADLPPGDYRQVQLAVGAAEAGEPMSLAVLPDRSVRHTAHDGTIRLTDPAGNTKHAGKLDVNTHDEEGLQGIAAEPAFATNRYVLRLLLSEAEHPGGRRPHDRHVRRLHTQGVK